MYIIIIQCNECVIRFLFFYLVKSSESSTHGVVTTHIFSFLVHFGCSTAAMLGNLGIYFPWFMLHLAHIFQVKIARTGS